MRLEKAMLIRLADGEELPGAETIQGYRDSKEQGDGENWMRVHFNPESLKTSISTNLKSQDKGKKVWSSTPPSSPPTSTRNSRTASRSRDSFTRMCAPSPGSSPSSS
ncbi:MAG: hypothetical protein P8Z31_12740 [Gammaproteobacteria bacterium]